MKQLLILSFFSLALFIQKTEAVLPDLNDLPMVKSTPLQETAALILWVNAGEAVKLRDGQFYHFESTEAERGNFNAIFKPFKGKGIASLIKALELNQLELERNGINFTLTDTLKRSSTFKIGTMKQLARHIKIIDEASFNRLVSGRYNVFPITIETNENGAAFLLQEDRLKTFFNALEAHPTVPELLLTNFKNLSSAQAVTINKYLGKIKGLQSISFENSDLSDMNVFWILANGLGDLDKIESLNLSNTGIGEDEANLLAENLPNMESLKILNLETNNLALSALAGSRHLEGLSSAFMKMPNLRSLRIGNNPLGDDGFKGLMVSLPWMRNLTDLSIQEIGLTDEQAEETATSLSSAINSSTVMELRNINLGDPLSEIIKAKFNPVLERLQSD